MKKKHLKQPRKVLHSFRFRKAVATTLTVMARKSGKTKTQLLEEALMMHAAELV